MNAGSIMALASQVSPFSFPYANAALTAFSFTRLRAGTNEKNDSNSYFKDRSPSHPAAPPKRGRG
jgi:hypothetical protein